MATACAPTDSGYGGPPPPPDTSAWEGYRVLGTEPFWSVEFGDGRMRYVPMDGTAADAPLPAPETLAGSYRFAAQANGQPFVVTIERRPCSDGMSDRSYPDTVTVDVEGGTLSGCGGDPAGLLIGAPWRIESLNGEALPADAGLTIAFDSGGRASGDTGCNRYFADYAIRGGLSFGPVGMTRRACADPARAAREQRFAALLPTVVGFDIAENGALILTGPEGPVLTARR